MPELPGLVGWEQSVLLTGVRLCGYSRVFCVTPWEVSVEGDPRWPELLPSPKRGACRWLPDAAPLVLLRKLEFGWGSAPVDLGAACAPQDALTLRFCCVCAWASSPCTWLRRPRAKGSAQSHGSELSLQFSSWSALVGALM